ncbi:hypothetical protein [Mesomycoplasma ovipneumoniae]|uniref:hypothetical protein n=1 Tax=Mesomycoplasma ovipneumoniae TaxID=29562 RepID=UPI003080F7B8
MSKKHGFTVIFAYLYSPKSEFLPSNWQTQDLKILEKISDLILFIKLVICSWQI